MLSMIYQNYQKASTIKIPGPKKRESSLLYDLGTILFCFKTLIYIYNLEYHYLKPIFRILNNYLEFL